MHLDIVVNQLLSQSALEQVANPAVITMQAVDNDTRLYMILRPLLSGGLHPLRIPSKSALPVGVYEPVGSSRWGDENFEMFRTDKYIVTLYAADLDQLVDLVEQVKAALLTYQSAGEFGAMEVSNVAIGFDDERNERAAAIEVEITHVTLPSQLAPIGYVYYTNVSAQNPETLNAARQLANSTFSVTLVCSHADLASVRLSVKHALGGLMIDGWPVAYVSGDRVTNIGPHVIWKETYQYQGLV